MDFVWGPPGTGKTETLAYVIAELCAQDRRVLVTSTTNAAVDQALSKLVQGGALAEQIARGAVVRIGHTDADTGGTALWEVVERVESRLRHRQQRLHQCVFAASIFFAARSRPATPGRSLAWSLTAGAVPKSDR